MTYGSFSYGSTSYGGGVSNQKPTFNSKFFQKQKFEDKTILRYFRDAVKNLKIALRGGQPEVIFKFSYDALIKTGITLIALYGYRIKSRKGHHVKILEKLSQILNNKNIEIIGDRMRKKRNLDLYEGGTLILRKEAKDYLNFVKEVIKKAEKHLKSQRSLF